MTDTQDITLHENVSYRGDGEPYWQLDLALPAASSLKPVPAVVFVHGGGWSECTKREPFEAEMIRRFAAHGYASASIEYRLTGVAPFPAQLNDVRCAVRFLRSRANEYGIDTTRFGAVGHSAGAHLAAMLGLVKDKEWISGSDPWAEHSGMVQAVVGLSGPYLLETLVGLSESAESALFDLLPGQRESIPARCASASPVSYITEDAPPFLLIHGTDDSVCTEEQVREFCAKLRQVSKNNAELIMHEGFGHMTHERDDVRDPIEQFFDKHLK